MMVPKALRILALASFLAAVGAPARNAGAQVPEILWLDGAHAGGVSNVRFSPDSRLVYTSGASDNTVKEWRVSDGRLLRTFTGSNAPTRGIALSPSGRFLASATDASWGSHTECLREQLTSDTSDRPVFMAPDTSDLPLWSVAYSRDGSRLAAGLNNFDLGIWNADTGQRLQTLSGHDWFTFKIAFSPDGTTLASASGDDTVKLWDVQTGVLLRTLVGHTFFVSGVAFAPDGRSLASSSWDGTVRFWNVATGANTRTVAFSGASLNSIDYSPDGQFVITGGTDTNDEGPVYVVRVTDGTVVDTLFPANSSALFDLAYSPDGSRIVAAGADGAIHQWNGADGAYSGPIGAARSSISDVACSLDGALIADCAGLNQQPFGNTVEILSGADGSILRSCVGQTDVLNAIAFSADAGRIVSGGGSPPPDTVDPSVRIWQVSDGRLLFRLAGHEGGTTAVDFAPAGHQVVSGGRDALVKVWSADTGILEHTLSAHTNVVKVVRYTTDGTLLGTAGWDGKLVLWNTSTWSQLRSTTLPGAIDWIAFSPDRSLIAAAFESLGNNVKILRTSDLSVAKTINADLNGWPTQVAFSPDGRSIVTTSGYTHVVRVWDVDTGTQLASYDKETGWGPFVGMPVRFMPDGARILLGRCDGTLAMILNPVRLTTLPPSAFSLLAGHLVSGDLSSLTLDDGDRLVVTSGIVPSTSVSPITVVFEATCPTTAPKSLQLKVQCTSTTPRLIQDIEFFDWTVGKYVTADERPVMLDDADAAGYIQDTARFVEPTSRTMRARLRVRAGGILPSSHFSASLDRVAFNIEP